MEYFGHRLDIVKSCELVIMWSYDIAGRGEWEFGQLVGYMWYLYVYDDHFHCGDMLATLTLLKIIS